MCSVTIKVFFVLLMTIMTMISVITIYIIRSIITPRIAPIINPRLVSGVEGGVSGDGVVVTPGSIGLTTTSVAACVGREDKNMRVKTTCKLN